MFQSDNIKTIKSYLLNLQNNICTALEAEENSEQKFLEDNWQYPHGGGGKSKVLQNGNIIEQGGVNFSHVMGAQLPPAATATRPELAGRSFEALGVSLVIHPRNPYVPTAHLNVRFFCAKKNDKNLDSKQLDFLQDANNVNTRSVQIVHEECEQVCNAAKKSSEKNIWWFGGGFDLTPYYGFVEDCAHWHQTAKNACDPFGTDLYPQLKKQCDDYFYLKHRAEPRGIGGLFFDDLNQWDFDRCFAFMQSVGDHFIKAYLPILQRRKNTAYGERERQFQLYRRGRYVEFNLIYDRGTLFGLQSGGRTESILMSLPPEVKWRYNWQPETGSPEAELYEKFLVVKDWLG